MRASPQLRRRTWPNPLGLLLVALLTYGGDALLVAAEPEATKAGPAKVAARPKRSTNSPQPERASRADRYDLTPKIAPGAVSRVTAQLEVGGELKVTSEGKVREVPLSVAGNLEYLERFLLRDSKDGRAARSLRHYTTAEAVIKVGKGGVKPSLSGQKRLLIADLAEGKTTVFSPTAALTREELDLVDVVGDTLALDAILPAKMLALGDTWQVNEQALQSLLGLDAVASCDVEGTLEEDKGSVLLCSLSGHVDGATEGVATELAVKAKFHYHRKHKRVTAINLAAKEERSIGHVGPGLDVIAKLSLRATPIDGDAKLSDEVLAEVDTNPTDENTRLLYESPQRGLTMRYDRRWYITGDEPELTVLRMVDRGDLVAQCNLATLPSRSVERPLPLVQYQDEVKHSLGENFGQFVRAGQWTNAQGQLVYRLIVHGQVDTLPIAWRYYHIAGRQGNRVALAFTVEGGLDEQLGDADRVLVDSIRLSPRKKESSANPQEPGGR